MNRSAKCEVRSAKFSPPPVRGRGRGRGVLLALTLLLAAPLHAQLPTTDRTTLTPRAGEIRVCAGGDVTLGTNLDTTWVHSVAARYGIRARALPSPDSLLAPLRPLVQDADVVLLNIEGAIGEGPAQRKCRPGSTMCFAFRQPVAAAGALRGLAPHAQVVGNLANNHAGDAGPEGLRQTAAHLRRAGVQVTGADTLATVVVTTRGDTMAVLGFSTSGGPDPRDLTAVRRHVRRAAERYPRVVVTMHMGAEGAGAQRTPDRTEIFLGNINRGNMVAFARTAAEAGATLVVGHGPHVMRAVEKHRGAVIFYSLGNLLTYGPFSFAEPMNRGALACASLASTGEVTRALLRATRQERPGFVEADPSRRAVALVDSLSQLDFPDSRLRLRADGWLLVPGALWPEPGVVADSLRKVEINPRVNPE